MGDSESSIVERMEAICDGLSHFDRLLVLGVVIRAIVDNDFYDEDSLSRLLKDYVYKKFGEKHDRS